VAESGLIAHGRGEAFDYLLGEKTLEQADNSAKAAVSLLLSSKKPVFSINGNIAALCPVDVVELAGLVGASLEVNLFYRTIDREKLIINVLKDSGADIVYGLNKRHIVPGLGGERANVDDALWDSDTVLVMLEDGDRTEALIKAGKNVIAIDLNPLSRTAKNADITIVDNVVRSIPKMIGYAHKLSKLDDDGLTKIMDSYDNDKMLKEMEDIIRNGVF